MEVNLRTQLELIEREKLISCKASAPIRRVDAIILDSQDLSILCKVAKSNNAEMILYCEKKIDSSMYHIRKEELKDNVDCFELMEKEIDAYNTLSEKIDYKEAQGASFYFVVSGKYFIQDIQYTNVPEIEFPTAQEKIHELLHSYSMETEQMQELQEQEEKRTELERENLLKEFEKFVRNDFKFIEFENQVHRRNYSKEIFRIHADAERFRTLFYAENDKRCENRGHSTQCYLELERIYQAMKREREEYRKTKEYVQRLAAFENFVHRDNAFWKASHSGHRRDYAYQVFLCNPKAAPYRTLFYFDCDVECKAHESRNECFGILENIYYQGRKIGIIPINFLGFLRGKKD